MPKSKLNSMPDYTAHLPKTPHDLSQSYGFTTAPGLIIPVYFDILHHGDDLHFSAAEFVRLNPLETAPLGEIEVNLDHFFVPLPVMYTPSSSMFYQTDDLLSSLVDRDALDSTNFPVYDFKGILDDSRTPFITEFDSVKTQAACFKDYQSLPLSQFECIGRSFYRMFDALRMNPSILGCEPADAVSIYPNFTPWYALAYQAIYQLSPLFRNTDREPKNYHYNIDQYYSVGSWTETDDLQNKKSIFSINYCQKHKDYFNSIKVSPMGSAVSMLRDPGDVFNSVNRWLNDMLFVPTDKNGSEQVSFSFSTQSRSEDDYVTSNNIRQLFMVDKLLRVLGRTEKNYESQFLAHYGIKVPHDQIHNITHIGHDIAVLNPQSVISSADTYNGETGSALGEVGGQGSVMLRGRKYNFTAPFVGVFMTVAYIRPRTRYIAGLDKLHQLSNVMDFWQPEFDKKGMQPIFAYEANAHQASMSVRLGWQYAYEQFKRRYDFVSLAFSPVASNADSGIVNGFSKWFLTNSPYTNLNNQGRIFDYGQWSDGVDLTRNLLVSPNALNGVMQVPHNCQWVDVGSWYVGTYSDYRPWLLFQTDPFICDFNMYMKKVNGMSQTGEPELDC